MKTKVILESWKRFLRESTGAHTASDIYNSLSDKFREDFDMVSEDGGFAWPGANQSDIDDYMSGDPVSGFKEFMSESDWEWSPSIFESGSNISKRDKVLVALYFMIHGKAMIEELTYNVTDPEEFETIKDITISIISDYGMPQVMARQTQQQADQAKADFITDRQIGE